jgi:hypothetical protein
VFFSKGEEDQTETAGNDSQTKQKEKGEQRPPSTYDN